MSARFAPGQIVKFKDNIIQDMRKSIEKLPNVIGPFPFGKLIIVSGQPYSGDIMYNYEYGWGGQHEGFAYGNDLEPYK